MADGRHGRPDGRDRPVGAEVQTPSSGRAPVVGAGAQWSRAACCWPGARVGGWRRGRPDAGDRDGRARCGRARARWSRRSPGWPSSLREGDRIGRAVGEAMPMPDAVVITGMGGSAMGGELLRSLIAGLCPVPITRVRGFGIPRWAGREDAGRVRQLLGQHRRDAVLRRAGARPARRPAGGRRGRAAGRAGRGVGRAVRAGAGRHAAAGGAGLPVRRHGRRVRRVRAGARRRRRARPPPASSRSTATRRASLGERLAATVPLVYGSRADGRGRLPLEDAAQRERQDARLQPRLPRARPQRDRRLGGRAARPVLGRRPARRVRGPGDAPDDRGDLRADRGDAALVEQVRGAGDSASARAFSMVAHGDWVSYHAALAAASTRCRSSGSAS